MVKKWLDFRGALQEFLNSKPALPKPCTMWIQLWPTQAGRVTNVAQAGLTFEEIQCCLLALACSGSFTSRYQYFTESKRRLTVQFYTPLFEHKPL